MRMWYSFTKFEIKIEMSIYAKNCRFIEWLLFFYTLRLKFIKMFSYAFYVFNVFYVFINRIICKYIKEKDSYNNTSM